MSRYPAGTRVFAVEVANKDRVLAYGMGTYIGDHPLPGTEHGPPESDREIIEAVIRKQDDDDTRVTFGRDLRAYAVAQGTMTRAEADAEDAADLTRDAAERARPMADRVQDLWTATRSNPKIVLDRGGVVWGAECWWGRADDVPESFVQGRPVTYVSAPHPATDRDVALAARARVELAEQTDGT